MRAWQFLKYNNLVPIAISLVLVGAGGAFAATDPGAIYSQTQQVVSIDNTYLVNKNLSTWSPSIEIIGVTQDSLNYYVAYTLYTIDLEDNVWQDVQRSDTLTVSKADLGPYRDLGVYATAAMHDIVSRELLRLQQTQADAKNNVTQETVATQYGGIVGKFLSPSTQQLPGYTPVVQPPAPPPQTAAASQSTQPPQQPSNQGSPQSSPPPSSPSAPVLQILGNSPAEVPLGSTYEDLGAYVVYPTNSNLGIDLLLNGTPVQKIQINTGQVAQYTITYQATDQNGQVGTATRIVDVYDPNATSTQQSATSSPSQTPPADTGDSGGSQTTQPSSDTSTTSAATSSSNDDASSTSDVLSQGALVLNNSTSTDGTGTQSDAGSADDSSASGSPQDASTQSDATASTSPDTSGDASTTTP